MKIAVVIPARLRSERLPGKPLADIAGRPMIVHVVERASQARGIDAVLVATDDEAIAGAVREYGYPAVITKPTHPSGTDRVAEVAENLDADVIVNVQGDEPLIDPLTIESAVEPFAEDSSLQMGSLKTPLRGAQELWNPAVVKVVCDDRDNALYFSRSPVPFIRDAMSLQHQEWRKEWDGVFFRHVGLYVYRRAFLLDITRRPVGRLERLEKLEQLRALEAGVSIRVPTIESASISVDTPQDLERVRSILGSGGAR